MNEETKETTESNPNAMVVVGDKTVEVPTSSPGIEILTQQAPMDFSAHQKSLIDWCHEKLSGLNVVANELSEAIAIATKNRWGTRKTLKNQLITIDKKRVYYQKIQALLQEGYMIIPNMPVQLFAVRTNAVKPKAGFTYYKWEDHRQQAKQLPAGEGEYKNPLPLQMEGPGSEKDDTGKTKTAYWASNFQDEIDFPITMCKPHIMEATSRAMALQIFDQFGILPATHKEDPIILGQITLRTAPYVTKVVSFLIAWRINTDDL